MRHRVLRCLFVCCLVTGVAGPSRAQEASATDDPLGSRLFFGSTGRAMGAGEGYGSITSLFLPAFQIGVTDRFSVGLGLPFYAAARSVYFTPKLQVYRSPSAQVSAGLVHVFVHGFMEGGYAHVTGTLGSQDAAMTVGAGWLYASDDDSHGGTLMFKAAAERRLSRRTKIISENYITRAGVIAMAGARFTRNRFSWDLAGVFALGPEGPAGPPGLLINLYWKPGS